MSREDLFGRAAVVERLFQQGHAAEVSVAERVVWGGCRGSPPAKLAFPFSAEESCFLLVGCGNFPPLGFLPTRAVQQSGVAKSVQEQQFPFRELLAFEKGLDRQCRAKNPIRPDSAILGEKNLAFLTKLNIKEVADAWGRLVRVKSFRATTGLWRLSAMISCVGFAVRRGVGFPLTRRNS